MSAGETYDALADREGFEPPVRLPVRRISSAVLSTAQPPVRRGDRDIGGPQAGRKPTRLTPGRKPRRLTPGRPAAPRRRVPAGPGAAAAAGPRTPRASAHRSRRADCPSAGGRPTGAPAPPLRQYRRRSEERRG